MIQMVGIRIARFDPFEELLGKELVVDPLKFLIRCF